jgi:hypothetical protein
LWLQRCRSSARAAGQLAVKIHHLPLLMGLRNDSRSKELSGSGFEEIDMRKCVLIRTSNKAFLTGVLVFLAGANASTVAVMMLL